MVLQDIEDYILLQGFKGTKPAQIQKLIENDHAERIMHQKKLLGKEGEEYEQAQKIESQKRKFMNGIRPPDYWNFFQDGAEQLKVKHVLRASADPKVSYCDGRIEKIMDNIEKIGKNLSSHEEVKWKQLKKYSLSIFEQEFKALNEKLNDS